MKSNRITILCLAIIAGLALLAVATFTTDSWTASSFFSTAPRSPLDKLYMEMGVLKLSPTGIPNDVKMSDLNGSTVRLSDFRGKIVFLNFWASWCPACVQEMPDMEKLHRKFRNRNFAMVTVNFSETPAQVKRYFQKEKLTFTALMDRDKKVAAMFWIRPIPTTFILSKSGKIIGKVVGSRDWASEKSYAFFEHLITDGEPR